MISCFTAGNPWTEPDGWDTLHPQLNLNLEDHQTPYVLHNGATHVVTEVGEFHLFSFVKIFQIVFVQALEH